VLDREPTGGGVVAHDGQVLGILRGSVRVDGGHRQIPAQGRPRVGPAADDDQPVDPAVEQRLHMVLIADRVAAGVAGEAGHFPGAESIFRPHEDRDAEPALEVVGQEAHGAGTAGEEASRHRVG
jgi:hypothetical protein